MPVTRHPAPMHHPAPLRGLPARAGWGCSSDHPALACGDGGGVAPTRSVLARTPSARFAATSLKGGVTRKPLLRGSVSHQSSMGGVALCPVYYP